MNQTARLAPTPRHPARVPLVLVGALAAMAVAALPITALFAQASASRYTVVETGRGFDRLQQAVDAIGDGRGTIAIAPGRYSECAVQTAGVISYRAAEPGTVVFDGKTCEAKARWCCSRVREVSGGIQPAVLDYTPGSP